METFSTQLQWWSQKRLTGYLDIQVSHLQQWSLVLDQGRLAWAKGGLHPQRRWRRLMNSFAPQFSEALRRDAETAIASGQEYQLLTLWTQRKTLDLEVANRWVYTTISEVLFDILLAEDSTPLSLTNSYTDDFKALLPLVNLDQLFNEVRQSWKYWGDLKISQVSPNLAPKIMQPALLRKELPPSIYQYLIQTVTGDHTVREIAIALKQPPLTVIRSLLPYFRNGSIRMVQVPDFSVSKDTEAFIESMIPAERTLLEPPKSQSSSSTQNLHPDRNASESALILESAKPPARLYPLSSEVPKAPPMILYVDDSRWECNRMELMLQTRGYRYTTIQDSIRALPAILESQPSLIFMDLIMPVANGYELCAQVRRSSALRYVPIVILTSNDGVIDRMRAKLVGATEFLSKPIQPGQLDLTLAKYCPF